MHYTSSDTINNSRIYSEFLQMGFDDGWSKNDKWDNFKILTDITRFTETPLQGATILDVGCGTGDLVQFLDDQLIKDYVGIDIFEEAIEKAREKLPDVKFVSGDFLKYSFRKKFDFVFCSGALTTKLDTDNYEMVESWIPKMWKLSKKGVGFNFLIGDQSDSDNLFLYDPEKVIAICRSQIPEAKLSTITTDAGSNSGLQEMHVFLF